jgi:hypothetical protein
MSVHAGPNTIENGLVLTLDAANTKLKRNALIYRWFATSGSNPTTQEGFDAFFNITPQDSGIDEAREINWLTVETRPSYIVPSTNFAWEVTGFLIITEPGEYIFNTRSDDGNQLQINNQILTSFYGGRGVPTLGDISSPIVLQIGEYPFRYRMQQGSGGAGAQVRWQKPGSSTYEVIPSTNFSVGSNNTSILDISGKNRNARLVNTVSINPAFGGVMDFARTPTKGFATIPHDAEISSQVFGSSTTFTLSAWVYVREFVDYGTLIQKAFAGSYSNSTCGLWVESPTSRNLRFVIGSNIGGNPAGSTTSVVFSGAAVNTWYHMVGVGNGTTAALYINNTLIGSTNFSNITLTRTENTSPITIGTRSVNNTPELDALVGPISVYNRALSSQEIAQNFQALRGRFGL